MPITVDVTVPGGVSTSVTSESTKATSNIHNRNTLYLDFKKIKMHAGVQQE